MAVALVVAAGRGERLGSEGPKAFVMLAGRPMIEWSLEALRGLPAVGRIVVALPSGAPAPEGPVGVPGGAQRSLSVRAALQAAGPGDRDEAVLVHDAARPLLSAELAGRVLDGLDGVDAAIAGTPVTDTTKQADSDRIVSRTLPREGLWAVQTPQVFRRAMLERALAVGDEQLATATDDASLVERIGGRVRIVPAPRENLKVTTLLDLRLAELLLAERRC